jgi:mono/diheme cytochrome c family protein
MKARTARLGALIATAVAATALSTAEPVRADEALIARGDYLARIMDCTGCHTPGTMSGNPDMTMYLAGGDVGFEIPGLGIFWPRNLTPDQETGLGSWSVDDIVRAVRTGETPDGRILAPIMPYKSYVALSDEDGLALATYLKSLAPISNQVPDPAGGPGDATQPYQSIVVPAP